MDPAYGSGSQILGLGLVFVLTVGLIVLGLVLMMIQRLLDPAFFRGEVLAVSDAVSDDAAEAEEAEESGPG